MLFAPFRSEPGRPRPGLNLTKAQPANSKLTVHRSLTRGIHLTTISTVTNRWIIPTLLIAFAVLIVALRAYVHSGEDLPPSTTTRRPAASPVAPDKTHADKPHRAANDRFLIPDRDRQEARRARIARRSSRERSRESSVDWRRIVNDLTRRLDDAAIRIRSNLDRNTYVQAVRGSADLRAGDHVAAIVRFDRVLAQRPNNIPTLSAKTAALVALQRFDQAADLSARLVRLAPDDATIRYNYGTLLYRRADFAPAAEQFHEAVRINPNHARAWYNLATLAQRAGRVGDARDAWLAFTRIQPNIADAWFNLGVVWMDFDEPLPAAHCFSQFVALSPDSPDGWLNLAIAYALADCIYEALDAMTIADDLEPCNRIIMRELAALHRIVARYGGPDANEHRRIAASIEGQLKPPNKPAIPTRAFAADDLDNWND